MDQLMARTMVETLAKGLNPLIGGSLPFTDICTNEDIQDALETVLAACTIPSVEAVLKEERERLKKERKAMRAARKSQTEIRFPRAGHPWSDEEDAKISVLSRYHNINYIAKIVGRTPVAISNRLVKLGIMPR